MSTKTMKNATALGAAALLGIAGAFAMATASPLRAAPTLLNVAAVKAATSIQITDVRYYRRGYARHGYYRRGYYRRGYYDPGAAAAAGLALGLFGAAAAAAATPYYYGGPGYYAPYGYYGYPPY